MNCPQCRTDVPAGARFCPNCGHELVVVGDQRRIATVLFADLVGFTALSETLDPEQVKGLVDRCFEGLARDIEAFGGRVDKVVGDAIVALFGAPVAHEDDAERAVRAGLRMQETIAGIAGKGEAPVQMRVGINTGEVLVGAVTAGREYTAMGDVVNTASRLQEAATPGTVLVGPETHAATRASVEYRTVDPVEARGKRLPVEAHVAVRATALPGQRSHRTRSPMVGRETELSLLTSITSTTIDRSRAALLIIHGEAGMGKSRLAAETAKRAESDLGATVLQGRCVPYGEANVWWPVADAVRGAAEIAVDATPEETEAALRRIVHLSLRESGRLDETDRVVAGLLHMLGQEGALRGIDATRAREEAVRSVVALVEGYSHRQPLLVVVSDLHWADDEVLDLLDTVLARLARRPLVLLATARRTLQDRWKPCPEAANAVTLHLDPLDDHASRRLLHQLTEGALHPSLAAMLVDRAGGNPFYLEELVSLITEAGVTTVDQLLAREGGELPSTLRGLVAARLDGLPTDERQMLDDAAVLGRRNQVDALVKMADVKRQVDSERARSLVEGLAAREFIVLDGDVYSFRSEVIRDVAYHTLTKSDRARSHAGIAMWIERYEDQSKEHIVDSVANHYAAAAELVADIGPVTAVPDDVRERAVTWLRKAAVRAEADFFPAMVAALATRALALMDDVDPERHVVLSLRAKSLVATYDLDGALSDAADAESIARVVGDDRAIGEAQLIQADALHHRGAYHDALARLDAADERFNAVGHIAGCAEALRMRGTVHLFHGHFVEADEALHRSLSLFEELGDPRGTAWAQQNLSLSSYMAGRVDEAEQRVLVSMEMFEELGDPGGLTWSRGLLAWVRFHQGRNDEAEQLALDVGRDARERGELWGEGMMANLTASIALWSGRTDDSVEAGRVALDLFERIDDRMGEMQARCGLGRAMVMSGDISGGLRLLEEALDEIADDESGLPGMAHVAVLNSSVQIGDLDRGRHLIDRTGLTPDQVGGADLVGCLAMFFAMSGDLERAAEALDKPIEKRGYVASARALVAAAAGQPDEALRHADTVVEVGHTYLDVAYADFARALALTSTGDIAGGRAAIVSAIDALDRTTDRLGQATARLIDASLAEATERPDAATARAVAEERLAGLGLSADGWRGLVDRALTSVSA